MYNEELEMLIDAALADGVLTDKEKQILFRKAQQYGVNLDEFEMVLEGRLAKVRAQRQQQVAPAPNRKGGPKKCPACGALIQSMQVKCPECGYEFHNVEANSTVKQLQQKLDEIEASAKPNSDDSEDDPVARRKAAVIKSCPVPNSKDDLIELLTLCSANYTPSANDVDNYEANAWKSKYKQVRAKAKILLKGDPDLEQVLREADKAVRINGLKKYSVLTAAIIVFLMFCGLLTCSHHGEDKESETNVTELNATPDTAEVADEQSYNTDNSADTEADESVSSSDDGEQSSSSKLKDKAHNWLDKQIDKATDKMNKKIDKEIEKLAQ